MSVKLTIEPEMLLCTRLNKEVHIEKRCLHFANEIETNYCCGSSFQCADSDCKIARDDKPNIYVELP